MSTSLAQNKTMVKLKLHSYVYSLEDGKLFTRHILLGLSGNNTLTDLTVDLHGPGWDWPEGNLVQRSLERVSLHNIPLDLVCNAIGFFGHVKELECDDIRPAQQSLSLDLVSKMSTSLAQNKTMVKLTIRSYYLSQVQNGKLFTCHLLLGLSGNNTLTDLTLGFQHDCWDWPEGNLVQSSVERVSLDEIPLDFVCEALKFFGHVKELQCTEIENPQQSLSLDLVSKMSTSLAQNKTMVKLVLGCQDLTLNEDVKLFTHHLLLGLSDNTTLTDLYLFLPEQCWDWLQEGSLVPRHVKMVTLGHVPLDLVCDVVKLFEDVEELNCQSIMAPQQSLSLELLNKMSTSLAQNKTMVKLRLDSDVDSLEDDKPFIRHLLLGLNGNNTLTDLTLNLPPSWWDWPEGNLVQSSVERVSLMWIPLDFVCEALKFFGHVKELQWKHIKNPQQSGVALDGLKLEELEGKLAGHESLKKLRFEIWAEGVPQKFGVAAVRGVARNKSIAEFHLDAWVHDHKVVDGILAQLTPDERRKFRVGKSRIGCPSIEICPVGDDPSSGGAPPSTDSQPTCEDTVMDLGRTEHRKPAMTGMIPEEEEEEEEEEEKEEKSPSSAKKIRKLQNDADEDDGTGVSEDHSTCTLSSATAAVNQRDDTAVSSIYSGSSTDDDSSAPSTPPSFTRVGGAPHWGETSARTDLSYIHPQTAKYLMKATVRPKEKSTATVTTTPTTTHPSTGHLSASHPPSRPSPSNSHSDSSVTAMPQGVAMHPLLDASALTRAQL